LSAAALAAEAELQRNEERIAEIRLDAQEKLPAYERSRLFQYLLERRFGTAEYRGRGLTRRLDRWVSRLIDFGRAQRSYEFLKRTPELMEQEVARRQREFHARMERIEAIEQTVAEATGLPATIQEVAQAEQERERRAKTHNEDADRVRLAAEELAALDQQEGQFYEDALGRYRRFLSDAETGVLQARAAQTPEPVDDELVQRVRFLSEELTELQPRVSQQQLEMQAADRRSEGLEFIVRRFEQSNFHIDRSSFEDGFDVRALIAQHRAGGLDRDAFWQALRRAQHTAPTEFERRASEALGRAAESPLAGVLMSAMVQAAGAASAALETAAGRSVERRVRHRRLLSEGGVDQPHPTWVRINSRKRDG
jgi:hypothetical protein